MNSRILEIHQRALTESQAHIKSEKNLISVFQDAEKEKVYLHFEKTSLYRYAVDILKHSDATALNLINVSRKATQVPELKAAILNSDLSVSKARKIVPVLTKENKDHWIKMAQTVTQDKLEREVARAKPETATPEKAKFVSGDRLKLELGVSDELMQKLRRIQDLISQRTRKPATLEGALEEMAELYIENRDPIRLAKRVHGKKRKKESDEKSKSGFEGKGNSPVVRQAALEFQALNKRKPINAQTQHELILRDSDRCTAQDSSGHRCSSKRWLHRHHIKPVSQGGDNSLNNLTLLCSAHHRMEHWK